MKHPGLLPLLLPLLVLTACGEDAEPPTASAPGGPAFDHTAGHKVVNSLADPGNGPCNAAQCTLREAINDPGSTEISFAPGLTGPITLARPAAGGGPLVIEKTLTITGPGTGIVIQRRSTDPAFRILRVVPDVSVKLRNLTLRNGKTDRTGAGLINFGTLALNNCRVADNSATQGGGGIANHGKLTLRNSRVTNNSGGGIDNQGNLTLVNSLVRGNSAGGIHNGLARLTVTTSTIADNIGSGISGVGQFTLANSRVTGNKTSHHGGGINQVGGGGQITNSTITGNSASFDGGGIANTQGGTLTIIKSTIAGNSAGNRGGGIFMRQIARVGGGSVTLRNSTVSGNSANLVGGGIFNFSEDGGPIILTNSTVARNRAIQEGGGIHQSSEGSVELTNSLVAQNRAPTGPDVNSPSDGHAFARFSLIGDGSGSGITNTNGNQVGTASAPIDPKLGPLANNGGPTRTHALLAGSPAIDAASSADCPATDQRGVSRPQGAGCDIGSYERE